jgi:hypothetical protein
MKLLLDENLPLRHEIVGHQASTVSFMGWSGIENGALLRQAAAAGFDALLTNDRGMQYEQAEFLPLAVVILMAPRNTIEAIRPLLPQLEQCLTTLQSQQLVTITPP